MKENELIYLWKNNSNTSRAKLFLLLLVAADFVFMFLHTLYVANVLDNPLLSLSREFGYPEIFQYIKEFWIVVLLLSILRKTRAIGYAIWALLFLYLLFDDALKIHETLGRYIAARFEFTPTLGLPAKVLGQVVVSAMAAAVFLIALILPYVRSTVAFKQVTRHLLLLLVALAFFGVFGDMLNTDGLNRWKYSGVLMTFVEEGGEMVVMSLIAWYVYLLKVLGGTVGITLRSPH